MKKTSDNRIPAPLLLLSYLVAALTLGACDVVGVGDLADRETDTIRHLVILYTNDEHGWMEPYQDTAGAAGMARLWNQRERQGASDHLLVLSGGDMWTGPALSTVLEGESMADVMNQMGYRAAAIGNHDFDFGQDALRARLAQSEFPFLSANIREIDTGDIPDFAQPYMVIEVNGIKIGIIGLTTTEAKVDTKPTYVENLRFMEYRDVIPTFAAKAREDGAELLMIIAHVCASETRQLTSLAVEYGISIIGGGHCHEEIDEIKDGVRLVESGFFMRSYMRIELLFDISTEQIAEIETRLIRNDARRIDDQISDRMDDWRSRTDPAIWEAIGYADSPVDRESAQMAELLLTPWLLTWPDADMALADPRYVQQDLSPGEITPATIFGMLSTSNELVEIELTGAQLIRILESRHPLLAGAFETDGYRLRSGEGIYADTIYKLLVPDALYTGGYYYEFLKIDPHPTFTGIDWRDPAIDWIRSLGTSSRDPLENHLDDLR